MKSLQASILASLLILLQVYSTIALPHDTHASQLNQCRRLLAKEKKFCKAWLHGIKPTQPVTTVTSTSTVKTTSTQTGIVTNIDSLAVTSSVFSTYDDFTTVTAQADTSTITTSVPTTLLTTTVSYVPKRRDVMGKGWIPKLPKVNQYDNNTITQACLFTLYGKNKYPTVTKDATVTLTTTEIDKQTSTAVATTTSTDVTVNIATSSATFTNTPLPSTVITTLMPTFTSISIFNPKLPSADGATCTSSGATSTCTYTGDVHNGLISTFIAPCIGTMSVQLDGGHSGNNNQNGYSRPGNSIISQVKFNGFNQIPLGTSYDLYIGGNGYSPYYENQNTNGGFNGGGKGNVISRFSSGSGGGGATDLRFQGVRIAVAGGGGGNGNNGGSAGIGDIYTPSLYTTTPQGGDGTNSGSGGGGGGYLGGQAGQNSGDGGYNGQNFGADQDLGYASGGGQAIVIFTCTV